MGLGCRTPPAGPRGQFLMNEAPSKALCFGPANSSPLLILIKCTSLRIARSGIFLC